MVETSEPLIRPGGVHQLDAGPRRNRCLLVVEMQQIIVELQLRQAERGGDGNNDGDDDPEPRIAHHVAVPRLDEGPRVCCSDWP